jgi:hypothetical protein
VQGWEAAASGVTDIRDKTDLQRRLKDQPRGVQMAIAARAAMRAIPWLDPLFLETFRDRLRQPPEDILLPLLRGAAMSWITAHRQSSNINSEFVVRSSVNATSIASDYLAPVARAFTVRSVITRSAVDRAGKDPIRSTYAAGSAVADAEGASAARNAARAIVAATVTADARRAVTPNAADSVGAAAKVQSNNDVWRSVSMDIYTVKEEGDPDRSIGRLATRPLWPDGPPDWVLEHWQALTSELLKLDHDWDVWIRWYEDRLYGRPFNEALEVARVSEITEEEWEQGPAVVNARIKEIEARFAERGSGALEAGPELGKELHGDLTQVPASHQYAYRAGKIVAYPLTGEPLDGQTVGELLDELQEKARAFVQATQKAGNCSPRVRQTAARLGQVLGEWEDQPQPGVLLSRLRSLEADIAAFDTPEGRRELFPDAVSVMVDLQTSASDLLSLYPIVQKIQASALALRIQTADVEKLHKQLAKIESSARASDIVDETAREALADRLEDIEEDSRLIATSSNETLIGKAIERRAQNTAHQVLSTRNFASALLRQAQEGVIQGVKDTTSGAVKASFSLLVGSVAGPLAAMAVYVGSLRPVAEKAKYIKRDSVADTPSNEP